MATMMPVLEEIDSRIRRSAERESRKFIASARVSKGERDELRAAAKKEGRALSEWCRDVLLRQARSGARDEALFTEIIATQMLLSVALRATATGQTMKPDDFSKLLINVRNKKHLTAAEQLAAYADRSGKEQ